MRKETFPPATTREIKRIVKTEVQKIKFSAHKDGVYRDPNWKEKISKEALDTLMPEDIDGCREKNLYVFSRGSSNKLLHIIKEKYPAKTIYSSGHFYYPPTGFMGWHTNCGTPDDHLYISYVEKGGESFFIYKEGDRIITSYDEEGLNIRSFSLSGTRPYFWHCVGSNCDRFSFGYRLCDTI